MIHRLLTLTIFSILFAAPAAVQAAPKGKIFTALSVRHADYSAEELIKMAGSEDALVKQLLQFRHDDSVPFVAVRSEKVLLSFAGRNDVSAALEKDLEDPGMLGLARIIAVHIDSVPNADVRRNLALLAIERSKRENSFLPYARSLKESRDKNVAELARKALN